MPERLDRGIETAYYLRWFELSLTPADLDAIVPEMSQAPEAVRKALRAPYAARRKELSAPKPPTGGGAPKPEAHESADATGEHVATGEVESTPIARLQAMLARWDNRFAVENGLAKHRAEWRGVDADDFVREVAARLEIVTVNDKQPLRGMHALNCARAWAHHLARGKAA
jgi:hypothetical protein